MIDQKQEGSPIVSDPQTSASERTAEVRSPEGLHMRPAMQFVECANGFKSRISVYKEEQCVDGKSIMQITMLAAVQGTKLRIVADGEDAEQAVEDLAEIIEQCPVKENPLDQK